jgi:hypothetical protein
VKALLADVGEWRAASALANWSGLVLGGSKKVSESCEAFNVWGPYSGMVVSGVACTSGSDAGGAWTCDG